MASYRQYQGASRNKSDPDFSGLGSYFTNPHARYEYSQLPFVGSIFRAMDNEKRMNRYLKAHGLTWDDVRYPALLGGTSYAGAVSDVGYSMMNMGISRNLLRLYK